MPSVGSYHPLDYLCGIYEGAFLLSKSDTIRKRYRELKDPLATNREIAAACELKDGFRPSAQLITSAIGSQSGRQGRIVNMQQNIELRRTCKRTFDNDWQAMAIAVDICADGSV